MSVKNMHRRGRTRRQFLGDTATVAAAGALAGGFPHIARGSEGIRTIGLAVSIINEIQSKASEDLGFAVRGQALGYGAMVGKMLNQNDQYDVAEGYFNDMDLMIPSKVWQPIDTQRITDWDKVTDLTKTGRLTPESNPGQGDAPFRHLWLDADGNRVEGPSRYISMLPGWHNADSLGYNPRIPAGPSRAGRSSSARISQERSRCSTPPRSGSWTPPSGWKGSGSTSSRTRAT